MNRRMFLAGAAAAAGAAGNTAKLAVEGGKPVRETPLKAGFFGTSVYGEEETRELADVVKVRRPFRWYGPGSEPPAKVATFEKEFARRMQTRYVLAVTSGSAALQTAVAACEIGPGDEVILPAWTWHSCFNAIVLAGALPVFAEVDRSFNIDAADVELKITPRTKAIMVIHLSGCAADMDRILAVARDEPRVVVSADADFGTILARTRASSRRSSWSDAPKGGESNSWWTWLWRIFRPSRRTSWLAASSCWVKAPSGSAGCRSSEHQDPVRIVEVGVRRDSSPALSALPVGVPSPWSASL